MVGGDAVRYSFRGVVLSDTWEASMQKRSQAALLLFISNMTYCSEEQQLQVMLPGSDQANPYKNGMSGFNRPRRRVHKVNQANAARVDKA